MVLLKRTPHSSNEPDLIDGDGVSDTISGVEDDSSGTSGSVEGEHSLDGDVHGGGVEGLEHDLGHLFSVGLGVKWGLSEQDGVLFGSNTELIVEGVVPDLLHIIPVGDDTVLNGSLKERKNSEKELNGWCSGYLWSSDGIPGKNDLDKNLKRVNLIHLITDRAAFRYFQMGYSNNIRNQKTNTIPLYGNISESAKSLRQHL
ncbi:hypothetical protein NECAME_09951 [Necator americanus]|uniref:Uncharacterized protein n=1 Tax=Necator americanus TaxID=51031 RepID=W2TDC0_NECAM|nr:hypothetical protein NECAME_09951 [Necator americanus]ETN79186.1 hypothetical protein NECAME_09951 [Necator americanus]